MLIDSATADDAGIFCLDAERALVQTVDFFTPVVDDPAAYGRIAAANALSDVYAMGGRPLTALNIVGMPVDLVSPETIAAILQGGYEKIREASCALIGGHTIRNPEPIYGLAVTGLVQRRHILSNAAGRPGDLLVLTKPLGTGIAATAIKRGMVSATLAEACVKSMERINFEGAELAERGLVAAATDITGFGLLGHLASLCNASGVTAQIQAAAVPMLDAEIRPLIEAGCVPGGTRDNLSAAQELAQWEGVADWLKVLLADAQTSGGLLLCVAPANVDAVQAVLRQTGGPGGAVIGVLNAPAAGAKIIVT